jgi:hypothetical protein
MTINTTVSGVLDFEDVDWVDVDVAAMFAGKDPGAKL